MEEDQYQLGIRKMTPHEMVCLITAYRNELMACRQLCKAFAQENFAQDALHKVACGYKYAQLDYMIRDYEYALKQADPQAEQEV